MFPAYAGENESVRHICICTLRRAFCAKEEARCSTCSKRKAIRRTRGRRTMPRLTPVQARTCSTSLRRSAPCALRKRRRSSCASRALLPRTLCVRCARSSMRVMFAADWASAASFACFCAILPRMRLRAWRRICRSSPSTGAGTMCSRFSAHRWQAAGERPRRVAKRGGSLPPREVAAVCQYFVA